MKNITFLVIIIGLIYLICYFISDLIIQRLEYKDIKQVKVIEVQSIDSLNDSIIFEFGLDSLIEDTINEEKI